MDRRRRGGKIGLFTVSGRMDYTIFFTVLLLCMFGLVMVFSASYYYAQSAHNDGLYYIKRQIIYLGIGFVAMLFLSRFDYHHLDKLKVVIFAAAVLLLVAVLFLGRDLNGGKRWLEIGGISVQPSEIAKFATIIYLAAFMSKKQALMSSFVGGILPMLLIIFIVCGLILLQPNMSMATIIAILGVGMMFLGGADKKFLFFIILAAVGAFFLLTLSGYRNVRLTIFLDPWQDPLDKGHQLIQSLYALGSGGMFGQGFNASRQKLLYLTYGESDFIFSIIGEELGWVGCVLLMLTYLFLIYRGMMVAMRCKERFGSLLSAGITLTLALQVAVNIGVVTSSVPTTGQTLPFVSAGGSSLIVFMMAVGVLLNISRSVDHSLPELPHRKNKQKEETVTPANG